MTYESRYELKATVKNSANAKDLTLYEACKALAKAASEGKVKDATHIRRDNRCVAFWCAWDKRVKGMFGAYDVERDLVDEWTIQAPNH